MLLLKYYTYIVVYVYLTGNTVPHKLLLRPSSIYLRPLNSWLANILPNNWFSKCSICPKNRIEFVLQQTFQFFQKKKIHFQINLRKYFHFAFNFLACLAFLKIFTLYLLTYIPSFYLYFACLAILRRRQNITFNLIMDPQSFNYGEKNQSASSKRIISFL